MPSKRKDKCHLLCSSSLCLTKRYDLMFLMLSQKKKAKLTFHRSRSSRSVTSGWSRCPWSTSHCRGRNRGSLSCRCRRLKKGNDLWGNAKFYSGAAFAHPISPGIRETFSYQQGLISTFAFALRRLFYSVSFDASLSLLIPLTFLDNKSSHAEKPGRRDERKRERNKREKEKKNKKKLFCRSLLSFHFQYPGFFSPQIFLYVHYSLCSPTWVQRNLLHFKNQAAKKTFLPAHFFPLFFFM